MDFIGGLGSLALGSRLRRLSDRIMADGAQIYRDRRLEFEPRWFPLFRLLADEGPHAVGEAARVLGLTHAAVSQTAGALLKRGILSAAADPQDERRRILAISDAGRAFLPALRHAWVDIDGAASDAVAESGIDLLAALDGLEHAFEEQGLAARTAERGRRRQYDAVEVVGYRPEYRHLFRSINMEWLEKLFEVEPVDLEVLDHPEETILERGGFILFGKLDGEVVGTCALQRDGDRFELTKMGVIHRCRGRQVGRKLLDEAIELARKAGAPAMFLVTNSSLEPAVTLYRSLGFRVVRSGPHPKYSRGDLTMELELGSG